MPAPPHGPSRDLSCDVVEEARKVDPVERLATRTIAWIEKETAQHSSKTTTEEGGVQRTRPAAQMFVSIRGLTPMECPKATKLLAGNSCRASAHRAGFGRPVDGHSAQNQKKQKFMLLYKTRSHEITVYARTATISGRVH